MSVSDVHMLEVDEDDKPPMTFEQLAKSTAFQETLLPSIRGWSMESTKQHVDLAQGSKTLRAAFIPNPPYAPPSPCRRIVLRVPESQITWNADIITDDAGNEVDVAWPYFDPQLAITPYRTFEDQTCKSFPSVEKWLLAMYKMSREAMNRLRNWHGLRWSTLSKLSLTMGTYYWDRHPCVIRPYTDGADAREEPTEGVLVPAHLRKQGLQGLNLLFGEEHDTDFYWGPHRPFSGPAVRVMLKLAESARPIMVYFVENALFPPAVRGAIQDQTPVIKVREWLSKLIVDPMACTWLFHSWIYREPACPGGLETMCFRVADRDTTEIHFGTQVQTWVTHVT